VSRNALFERLSRAASGVVVVTTSRRLARDIGRQFDAWQLGQGRRAWETPRVLPFGAFVSGLHDIAQHDPALTGVRAPLGPAQERALWEGVIEAGDVPLASPAGAAQLAAEAWSLAHQWQIADRLRHYALTEDTRVFARWAAEYERRVERNAAVDQARLPDVVRALIVAGSLASPEEIVLAGFDELTPQQAAFFEALATRGARIERLADERGPGDCRRQAAADAHDELERMADWVANRLAANPEARIGIVVPDLSTRRRAVARALDAALMPDALLAPPDRARPYTVSLGGSLADIPLVATALRGLRLAIEDVEFSEASALLRSPHVQFGPAPARALFDVDWRRRAGPMVSLAHLVSAARGARNGEPIAPRAGLEALQAWRQGIRPGRRRLSEWAALFIEGLRAIGFPGQQAPDSAEYQALVRWQELLAEFASLERVQGPLDLGGAFRRLARLAASTIFQPEGGDPPVQVLGLLEANGLEFDHLWITGLTSEGWPLPARPHPMLPLELQRARRMPGALAEIELQRARTTLDRLTRSAGEVIASHATRDGDRSLAPASMLADWSIASPVARARRALDVVAPEPLDMLADAVAPELPDARNVGGGVAILTDQSACPFRAFAKHRLAAGEPEQPHDGLAASERGDLVHRVLAGFWRSMPERTRAVVAGMTADDRSVALERAADQAIARIRARRLDGVGARLLGLEKRRLVSLVAQWLQFEIDSRDEFEVKWIEERRALAIGRLSLTGQLDRVDALPDGRTIIIDYKTGGPSSVKAWLGERPDEPQLPLYLVASEPDARGIAFARLRAGERRFVALAEDKSMLPGARVEDWQRDHADWRALVEAWRAELTTLADGFASGVATVAPKRVDTCRYCGVAMLCRYSERIGDRGEPAPDEETIDD
jgi:probable DNA repair protein